jgi:hypothetical protein
MAEEKKDETKTAAANEADKKAEADKRNETKAHSNERAAATYGAESVAQAVKKVADAAVQAVQAPLSVLEGDFVATGSPGGSLEIVALHGNKLGSSGTVTVSGKQAETTEWSVDRIFGKMPPEVTEGEVVVHVDEKTKYTAMLNGATAPSTRASTHHTPAPALSTK